MAFPFAKSGPLNVRPFKDIDVGDGRRSFGGGSGGGRTRIYIDRVYFSFDSEQIVYEGMRGRNGEELVIGAIERVQTRKGLK